KPFEPVVGTKPPPSIVIPGCASGWGMYALISRTWKLGSFGSVVGALACQLTLVKPAGAAGLLSFRLASVDVAPAVTGIFYLDRRERSLWLLEPDETKMALRQLSDRPTLSAFPIPGDSVRLRRFRAICILPNFPTFSAPPRLRGEA